MSRLIITIATTIDGVIDGFEWFVPEGGHTDASLAQFNDAAAMLLGRKTYEGLAAFWPTQEGPWAERLNAMPKFVASRTLSGELDWGARVLEGELADSVPMLKDELGGDLIVSGCGEFARNLIVGGLVDEIRFGVHPVVWGDGGRPFEGETVRMRLLESTSYDSGVTLLRYAPA